MNEREALIQSIRENPDDDTPRLIFADWLESTGEWIDAMRATYIRAQCQAAQVGWDHPDKARSQKVFDEIQEQCVLRWFAALDEIGYPLDALEFHRGFISSLTLPADDIFFEEVVEKFLPSDHVDLMTFGCPTGELPQALRHPGIGLLPKILVAYRPSEEGSDVIESGRGDEAVTTIAAIPRRTPLYTYATSRSGLSDRAASTLATSAAFANLRMLSLDGVRFTVDGLKVFKNAVFAKTLNKFILSKVDDAPWGGAEHGPETAEVFARGGFDRLTHLDLAGYPLGDAGLHVLSASGLAGQIEKFRLHADNNLHRDGIQSLLDENKWPALKSLSLTPVHCHGKRLRLILTSERFRSLDVFEVFFADELGNGAELFATNPAISGLKELGFTGLDVRDSAIRALIESPYLNGLGKLSVNANGISGETLFRLAEPDVFPGLTMLQLTQLREMPADAEAALRTRYGAGFHFDIRGA